MCSAGDGFPIPDPAKHFYIIHLCSLPLLSFSHRLKKFSSISLVLLKWKSLPFSFCLFINYFIYKTFYFIFFTTHHALHFARNIHQFSHPSKKYLLSHQQQQKSQHSQIDIVHFVVAINDNNLALYTLTHIPRFSLSSSSHTILITLSLSLSWLNKNFAIQKGLSCNRYTFNIITNPERKKKYIFNVDVQIKHFLVCCCSSDRKVLVYTIHFLSFSSSLFYYKYFHTKCMSILHRVDLILCFQFFHFCILLLFSSIIIFSSMYKRQNNQMKKKKNILWPW